MYVCMYVCMYVSRSVRFKSRIGMIRFKTRPSPSPPISFFAWSNEPNGNICRDGGTWWGEECYNI